MKQGIREPEKSETRVPVDSRGTKDEPVHGDRAIGRFRSVLKSQCVTTKWSDKFAEPTAGLLASQDQPRSG